MIIRLKAEILSFKRYTSLIIKIMFTYLHENSFKTAILFKDHLSLVSNAYLALFLPINI